MINTYFLFYVAISIAINSLYILKMVKQLGKKGYEDRFFV